MSKTFQFVLVCSIVVFASAQSTPKYAFEVFYSGQNCQGNHVSYQMHNTVVCRPIGNTGFSLRWSCAGGVPNKIVYNSSSCITGTEYSTTQETTCSNTSSTVSCVDSLIPPLPVEIATFAYNTYDDCIYNASFAYWNGNVRLCLPSQGGTTWTKTMCTVPNATAVVYYGESSCSVPQSHVFSNTPRDCLIAADGLYKRRQCLTYQEFILRSPPYTIVYEPPSSIASPKGESTSPVSANPIASSSPASPAVPSASPSGANIKIKITLILNIKLTGSSSNGQIVDSDITFMLATVQRVLVSLGGLNASDIEIQIELDAPKAKLTVIMFAPLSALSFYSSSESSMIASNINSEAQGRFLVESIASSTSAPKVGAATSTQIPLLALIVVIIIAAMLFVSY